MNDDPVETRMFAIFQLVNDWLKFAEAKNLAILTLSGAACSGLVSYITASTGLSAGEKKSLLVPVFLFALSTLISLLSFIPRTSQNRLLGLFPDWGQPQDDDNVYFYKDLGKYEKDGLAGKFATVFAAAKDTNSPAAPRPVSHIHLAAQIIVNSRLVVFKLRFFAVALTLSALAVATVCGILIYKVAGG